MMRKVIFGALVVLLVAVGYHLYDNTQQFGLYVGHYFAHEANKFGRNGKHKFTLSCKESESPCQRLSRAIQFETLNRSNNASTFAQFRSFISQAYPLVHKKLEKEMVNTDAYLFKWRGKSEKRAALLASHYDVVPIPADSWVKWSHPPFSGHIANSEHNKEDGLYIWGRGALDVKSGMIAILEAVEHLLQQEFTPERTIYLAFGADEESGGSQGAAAIAQLLKQREVDLDFVLDEGGVILTEAAFPGVDAPVAVIGVAEKGFVSVKLSVDVEGGHSSMPGQETAISIMANAVTKLVDNQMAAELNSGVIHKMFEFLAPHMPQVLRVVLANTGLFGPVVTRVLSRQATANALMRTTTAPTIFQAGKVDNVLPSNAEAVINFRVAPHDSVEKVFRHVKRVVGSDERIKVSSLGKEWEPSSVSCIECDHFSLLYHTAKQNAAKYSKKELVVMPYIMVGASDSRYYRRVTANVYNYFPMRLNKQLLGSIHGVDERIQVDNFVEMIDFMFHLIQNLEQL